MNHFYEQAARTQEEQLGTWAPAVDIYETEKEIVLKADLPGVNLSDVDIRVENNILTVSGERHFEKEVKQDNFHRVERVYGNFARTFTLPNTVNSEKIDATYENGVLKITMQKREEARPKQIKIAVTAKAA
jgi:HSP20 family protein